MDTPCPPASHLFRRAETPDGRLSLTACSICLRVLRRSGWIAPDELIRGMRTHEMAAVPRLGPALCDRCSDSIRLRREWPEEPLAA